jgi:hypothetical protein
MEATETSNSEKSIVRNINAKDKITSIKVKKITNIQRLKLEV